MRVDKMAAIARTVQTENALALQRSSFRENPTYFLTSVRHWVCELVFDAIYDWRSEFSHNRQNEKALKCKPSALLFGRGRAKKSIALQGSYNIGIHVKISKASADKAHALTKM